MHAETKPTHQITLAEMRRMPLRQLAGLDLSILEDLKSKATSALREAKRLNSRDLLFNVQFAKSWIDFAIRFKNWS